MATLALHARESELALIEVLMYRRFPKLGISSRAQLRTVLGSD